MILTQLEQYLAKSGEEFPKIIVILTTISLTSSKSPSTVGLNFPTSEIMGGWTDLRKIPNGLAPL